MPGSVGYYKYYYQFDLLRQKQMVAFHIVNDYLRKATTSIVFILNYFSSFAEVRIAKKTPAKYCNLLSIRKNGMRLQNRLKLYRDYFLK